MFGKELRKVENKESFREKMSKQATLPRALKLEKHFRECNQSC